MRRSANYIVFASSPRLLTLYIDVRDALLTSMSTRRSTNDRLGNDSTTAKTAATPGGRRERIYYGAWWAADWNYSVPIIVYTTIGFLSPNPSRIMHLSRRGYRPLRTAHWGI